MMQAKLQQRVICKMKATCFLIYGASWSIGALANSVLIFFLSLFLRRVGSYAIIFVIKKHLVIWKPSYGHPLYDKMFRKSSKFFIISLSMLLSALIFFHPYLLILDVFHLLWRWMQLQILTCFPIPNLQVVLFLCWLFADFTWFVIFASLTWQQ